MSGCFAGGLLDSKANTAQLTLLEVAQLQAATTTLRASGRRSRATPWLRFSGTFVRRATLNILVDRSVPGAVQGRKGPYITDGSFP